jgi:transcriptional regulator with XRE-family HTH domain
MKDNRTPLQGFGPCGFGKRLQSARKALGITQEELAERLHVDRNHITRMERGIRVCSIDLLVEISVALEVSTDYLLSGVIPNTTTKQSLLIAIEELNKIAQSL